MTDFGAEQARRRYCEAFLAAAAPTIAATVAITSASTAATLSTISPALVYGGVYGIAATGIPASTSFVFRGTAAIVLSQAATATNGAASATLSPS